MEEHSTHAGVQEAGCWAIWFLSADDTYQKQIAAEGGIKQVVEAMAAHAAFKALSRR
jgi:hypothetical protein